MDGARPQQEAPPTSPWYSLLGGAGVAQPGQSEVVRAGDSRPVTLLNLNCEPMYGAVVTVALSLSRAAPPPDPLADLETAPVVARVTFGNGGTQCQTELDVLDGTIFCVPAAWLRLDVFIDPSAPEDAPDTTVHAIVGHFPHGRGRAQRTIVADGPVADAGTVILPIPPFANRLEVHAEAAATWTVEQGPDQALATVLSFAALAAPAPFGVVPIVNAARFVRLTNTTGGGAARTPRAVFQLAL